MIDIIKCSEVDEASILCREQAEASPQIEQIVADILADVRTRGDEAVLEYTARFDKAELDTLKVSEAEIEEALSAIDPSLYATIERAASNIKAFHMAQRRTGFELTPSEGIVLGQRVLPLETVGVYVPGGTARYPSTVLMDAIPAQIAGVKNIIMATPPDADGSIPAPVLAAAHIAGVTSIFKMGGSQAVAALAYGTQSVPRVDKIVGPGNIFVATAKRQVFGIVDIDMVAGPSEILVVADAVADPRVVAADLLSQAEHDRMATAVLITPSEDLARAVIIQLEEQLATLPREEIARASLENNGKILVAADIDECIELANRLAPEHLELSIDDPFAYLDKVKNAGCVFLGRNTPEALGDYWAGPNHTLPTLGTARFSSPLSVDDFIKKSNYVSYAPEALEAVATDIETFARTESLEAHARSVAVRFE